MKISTLLSLLVLFFALAGAASLNAQPGGDLGDDRDDSGDGTGDGDNGDDGDNGNDDDGDDNGGGEIDLDGFLGISDQTLIAGELWNTVFSVSYQGGSVENITWDESSGFPDFLSAALIVPVPPGNTNYWSITSYVAVKDIGQHRVVFRAADNTVQPPVTAEIEVTYTVKASRKTDLVEIETDLLPDGLVGYDYGPVALEATGSQGDYDWSLTQGLPQGLYITDEGMLEGNPSSATPGVYDVLLVATTYYPVGNDYTGRSDDEYVTLEIFGEAQPNINIPPLPSAWEGEEYPVASFSVESGGLGPYVWAASNLPAGLDISEEGVFSGIPEAGSAGDYVIDVTVAPATGESYTVSLDFTVYMPLEILTVDFPAISIDQRYQALLGAVGGSGRYTWKSTGALPEGIWIEQVPEGWALYGLARPQTAGRSYPTSLEVTDQNDSTRKGYASFTIEVLDVDSPELVVLTGYLPHGRENEMYEPVELNAGGGDGVYDWSGVSGLPAGLMVVPDGKGQALVTGMPEVGTNGLHDVVLVVRDGEGQSAELQTKIFVLMSDERDQSDSESGSLPEFNADLVGAAAAGCQVGSNGSLPLGLGVVLAMLGLLACARRAAICRVA